jgi:hypothetical protein
MKLKKPSADTTKMFKYDVTGAIWKTYRSDENRNLKNSS